MSAQFVGYPVNTLRCGRLQMQFAAFVINGAFEAFGVALSRQDLFAQPMAECLGIDQSPITSHFSDLISEPQRRRLLLFSYKAKW